MTHRSARFEVSYHCDVDVTETNATELDRHKDDDYIVLEIGSEDLRRLKKTVDQSIAIDDAFIKSGKESGGLLCILFHGKAHPQRGDRSDGTISWPPSILSAEVIAESPKPERWK